MENKNNGSSIFLGVIGVATLVVAIIGATFAYFSAATNSTANAIATSSTTLGLNLVDNVGTNLKTNLIPATESIATYGALSKTYLGTAGKEQCVDDNGNEICSIYQFTITNPSTTTAQALTFTMNIQTNSFANLKYKIYEGTSGVSGTLDNDSTAVISAATLPTITESSSASEKTIALTALNDTYAPEASKTYTIVIWINELGTGESGNQTSVDAGKAFAAGLNISSGNGSGVTGVISTAG